ncbi:MotE family protein [Oceaniglobus trochenteri]|uniref:MotE family protein n=1 Tax=Oceaniglobus trochenteri TaxID=2763260 RepID=UPI001CFF6D33|nr:hypothetical protein [Oceaniglobus trochenteri]
MTTPKRSFRHGWRLGPLSFVALLLIASGVLRFLGGPAAAIAKEVADLSATENAETARQCEPPPDLAEVLEALSTREARLKDREAYVAERSARLAEAEQEIERQIAALVAAENQLEQTLTMASTAAEDDVARLTAVYENMKPKEAAILFETMSPEFAAGFLGRMRPDVAAKVVEGLSPDSAYSISVILAGRNAEAPTNERR